MNLIGVTGLAGAGKDTVGQYLVQEYNFKRMAFADKLKEFCEQIDPDCKRMVNKFGWDNAKRLPRYRELQQSVGHGAREVFGENFWISQVMNNLHENTVITDVRYKNEFDAVRDAGGYVIRVFRPELQPVNNHITEVGHLSLPVDYTIINDDDIYGLYNKIDQMMIDLGYLEIKENL